MNVLDFKRERSQLIAWENASQGDIIDLHALHYWQGPGSDDMERMDTPDGVVLVSQTCDLVQVNSKNYVTVAPVRNCSDSELSQVKKGQRPLWVVVGTNRDKVVDLERVLSLPRNTLENARVIEKTCRDQSSRDAAKLAEQLGRGYSRFAFPDAVHESLRKLKKKIANGYLKQSNFAQVLQIIHEFRISCNDWNTAGRELMVWALVPANYLPSEDSQGDDWVWSTDTVCGISQSMQPHELDLERLSELIIMNAASKNDGALVELWWRWGDRLQADLLDHTDSEVTSIEFQVVSAADMTYELFLTTEVLDFSALSLSHGVDE